MKIYIILIVKKKITLKIFLIKFWLVCCLRFRACELLLFFFDKNEDSEV